MSFLYHHYAVKTCQNNSKRTLSIFVEIGPLGGMSQSKSSEFRYSAAGGGSAWFKMALGPEAAQELRSVLTRIGRLVNANCAFAMSLNAKFFRDHPSVIGLHHAVMDGSDDDTKLTKFERLMTNPQLEGGPAR